MQRAKQINPLTVRLLPERIEELDRAAAKIGLSRNRLITTAIEKVLRELEENQAA